MRHNNIEKSGGRVLLAALLFSLAFGAAAQRVYRIVGPDGKVTFSDQPPPDREATLVKGSPPASAASAAAGSGYPKFPEPTEPASREGRTKQAKKALPSPPAQASTPEAVEAIARGLGRLTNMESLIEGFEQICSAALPSSMKKWAGAADVWRDRHADLLARRDIAFNTLSPAQRQSVLEDSRASVHRVLESVRQGQMAQRIKWCDQSVLEIQSGKLDIYRDPAVAGLRAIER